MTDSIERLYSPDADPEQREWEKSVRERFRFACANCGNTERLGIKMIVPLEAGGQRTISNGVLLCRSCEMASDSLSKKSESGQRLVNFWVSHELFEQIRIGLEEYQTFSSMGALVRYLVGKYVEDDRKFEDLDLYQDRGTDSKLNVWVSRDEYAKFKELLDARGTSVTDAIRSLIRMWLEVEAEKARPRRQLVQEVKE